MSKWGMFHNDSEKVKCVHLFPKITLFSPKSAFKKQYVINSTKTEFHGKCSIN